MFNLRALLSDPAGDNLRNRALHGLSSQFEYELRPAYEFTWWLTLFLCIRFRLLADQPPADPQTTEDQSANEDAGTEAGAGPE